MQEEIIRDWEGWAAIVTVIGLPFAMAVYIFEQRRERRTDDEEIYQRLSDSYRQFLRLVLEHSDLGLMGPSEYTHRTLNREQREQQFVLFGILIAIFEQAYILVYEERMDRQTSRLWQSWEDYMREWCRKREFREALPELLQGEDPEFVAHIVQIAQEMPGGPQQGLQGMERLKPDLKGF